MTLDQARAILERQQRTYERRNQEMTEERQRWGGPSAITVDAMQAASRLVCKYKEIVEIMERESVNPAWGIF